jgi:hypothetical protein
MTPSVDLPFPVFQEELDLLLDTFYKSNASGFIIWGSSNDVNTVEKCQQLLNYTEQILGPSIARYTKTERRDSINVITTDNPTLSTGITTWRPILKDHIDNKPTTAKPSLDPDYHWEPPENYAQDIVHYVENEMKTKNNTLIQDSGKPQFISIKENTLLDLLFNLLANMHNETDINDIDNNGKEKFETNVITSTPLNKLIKNNSIAISLNENSITTNNPLLTLNKQQNLTIPLNKTVNDINTISSKDHIFTTFPTFTTKTYTSTSNENYLKSIKNNTTTESIKNLITDNDLINISQGSTKSPIFNNVIEAMTTTENSSNFKSSTDSSTTTYDSTPNILDTDITFDDLYDPFDNYTSQIDYNSSLESITSTEPSSYLLLDILSNSETTTVESTVVKNIESQSKDKKKGYHLPSEPKFYEKEFIAITENYELQSTKASTEEYTTDSETSTKPFNDTINTIEERNESTTTRDLTANISEIVKYVFITNKNVKKGYHKEVIEPSISIESTTENDIFTTEEAEVPDKFNGELEEEESSTSAARQVVVL